MHLSSLQLNYNLQLNHSSAVQSGPLYIKLRPHSWTDYKIITRTSLSIACQSHCYSNRFKQNFLYKIFDFCVSRMSSPDAEVRLYDSPTDSISSLNFNSDGSRLLCSAWDSKLRLYNVDKERFLQSQFQDHWSSILELPF